MKLLIVAATQEELTGLYHQFNLPKHDFAQTPNFDILITGVGMTATAFALGRHLSAVYDLVLNVGIAGSFDPNIPLGSLVNIETDTFAELGAEDHDHFLSIADLGFGTTTFNANYKLTDLINTKAITVNKVHGNAKSIGATLKRLTIQTESMEGAAVFYACHKLGIPSAQVRSISNYVEPRNRDNWQIRLAIENLNKWIIKFLNSKYLMS